MGVVKHNIELEPKAYRTRVWCDGTYVGSLFRECASGELRGYIAKWQEGDLSIEPALFKTRKGAVDYLIECAEAQGRLA